MPRGQRRSRLAPLLVTSALGPLLLGPRRDGGVAVALPGKVPARLRHRQAGSRGESQSVADTSPGRQGFAGGTLRQRVVPRLNASEISRSGLEELVKCGPVLLTNAIEGLDTKAWCKDLMRAMHREPLAYQQQRAGPWDLLMHETTLRGFMREVLPRSSHEDPRFLFDEDFLARKPAQAACLSDRLSLPRRLFGENWFDHFPDHLRPAPCCIVGAGIGARSTLHRDPFEWTGTSVCLWGSKIWTFLPPSSNVSAVDASFESYRFPYQSYGSDGASLAAGWQADVDLYAVRDMSRCPGPRELAEAAQGVGRTKAAEATAAALRRWWAARSSLGTSEKPRTPVPPLRPRDSAIARLPDVVVPTCVVQRRGDLLLIPAHWWHQTYAPEPSIAVAGQFLNEGNCQAVARHVCQWRGVADLAEKCLAEHEPRQWVDSFLRSVLPHDVLSGSAATGELANSDEQWEGLGLEFSMDDL
ncbi:unnamed protein product [Prorocentrum cordatum]|uniref:JmjC domain-containing protein n=1 Tax=Prorocentrum cordatum TaxID=2364126 RepID=A0ABN9TXA0_9DINO|nr:unnamed protein product [Polarella glacialis]